MYQPSISTKKITLNGREIKTGGSIIMPALIKTDGEFAALRNGTETPTSRLQVCAEAKEEAKDLVKKIKREAGIDDGKRGTEAQKASAKKALAQAKSDLQVGRD